MTEIDLRPWHTGPRCSRKNIDLGLIDLPINTAVYTDDQVREFMRLTGEDVKHLSEVLLARDQVIQKMIEKLNRTEAMRDALERYGAMRAVCDAVGKYITVHDGVDWESNDVVYPGPELKVIDALRKLRELEKCHD